MAYNAAQGHPQGQYPASVVYYAAPAINYQQAVVKRNGQRYDSQTSSGLGATQIILACVSVTAGTMAIFYGAHNYQIGIGIWAGPLYLIAGSIAIAAGKDPSIQLITATLIFSIIDFILGIAEVTIASIGLREDIECYYYSSFRDECFYWWAPVIAANSMMVAVGSLEIIFGFCLMVISARAIDKDSKAQVAIVPVTQTPHQPQRVFVQAPSAFQSQPPPYNTQQQYQSTSNPQQTMYVGAHQAPSKTVKF